MITSIRIGPSGGLPKNTNDPLPEAQKREIQAMILAEQAAICLIDAEISQRRSALTVNILQSRRSMKKDLVSFLKILVSPIKEIPNEIIARIFERYAYGPFPDPNSLDPRPPWYLGHICSRWRSVALSTPNLWNFFTVKIDELTGGYSRSFDIARYLLPRTGQSYFSCIANRAEPKSTDIACLFDLFSFHIDRLRYLKIDGVDGISSLAGIPQVSLRSLEVLDILCYQLDDTSGDDSHPSSITLFDETPCLRRVSIFTLDEESSDPLSLCLPWHQLTHLCITNSGFPTFHSTHTLLLHCPNLTECSLNMPEDNHSPLTLSVITLRYLESLSLRSKGRGMYGKFLQYLSVPCLKRFTLASKRIESSWSSDDVVDFLSRSVCQIEALKCSLYLSRLFLLEILNVTPSLKRLSMATSAMLPEIIEHMIWNPFVPELRLIQCVDEDLMFTMERLKGVVDDPELDQVVSNRMKSLGIDLVVKHPFEKAAWAADLRALSVKGLEVDMRDQEDRGFMDYPDGEVFGESLVNRRPYYMEVEYW